MWKAVSLQTRKEEKEAVTEEEEESSVVQDYLAME